MKKLILLLLAVVSLSVMGQKNIGNYDRMNVKTKLNVMADTFTWEETTIYKDSLYYTEVRGDSCRFKQLGSDIWSQWIGGGGGTTGSTSNSFFTQLIYGTVTWTGTGLTFDVSECLYYIMGNVYLSDPYTITLDPADPDLNRFDVIYVDTLENVGKITGEPAEDPYEPLVDPLAQLRLTIIYVGAGMLTPGFEADPIYYENVEWTGSVNNLSSGSSVTFNNTVTPYAGDSCVNVTSTGNLNNTKFRFTRASVRSVTEADLLVFYIKTSGSWGAKHWIGFQWFNGNSRICSALTIGEGSYGFTSTSTAWQKIAIPMKDFRLTATELTNLRISFSGVWTPKTIKFDNIEIQSNAVITDGLSGVGTGDYVTKWISPKVLGNSVMRNRNYEVGVGDWGVPYTRFSIFPDSAFLSGVGTQESRGLYIYANPSMSWGSSAKVIGVDVIMAPYASDTTFGIRTTSISTSSDVNYANWGWASGAMKNYAFYGEQGRLYIKDSFGLNVLDPEKPMDIDGTAQLRDTLIMQTVPENENAGLKKYLVMDGDTVKFYERADSDSVLYTLSAETGTGGAWLKITGSDGSKDSVLMAEGTAMTINRTDENTITFNSTPGATYTISAETGTGGAYVKILGSDGSKDSVKLAAGSNVTINRTDENTITFTSVNDSDAVNYSVLAVASDSGAYVKILGTDGSKDSIFLWNKERMNIVYEDDSTISFSSDSTTYLLTAEPGTGGAWVKILGTDGSMDSVLLAEGTNMSISQTNDSTITFDASGTSYTMVAVDDTSGAWMKILGADGSMDSVLLRMNGDIDISYLTEDTIDLTVTFPDYTLDAATGTNGAWMKITGSDGSMDSVFLAQDGGTTVTYTSQDTITFGSSGGGATYNLLATTGTGGAWMKILGSDGSKDSVMLAEGSGISSIVATNDSTITINVDDNATHYMLYATSGTGGAYIKISGSDGVKDSILLAEDGGTTISYTNDSTITIGSTGGAGATYTMSAISDENGAWMKILGSDGSKDSVLLYEAGGVTITYINEDSISLAAGGGDSYWKRVSQRLSPIEAADTVYARTLSDSTAYLSNGILNHANINLTIPPGTGEWNGVTMTLTAGETLIFGDVCYISPSTGRLMEADADAYSTSGAGFMALGSATDGNTVLCLVYGLATYSGWSWTPGARLFLSVSTGSMSESVVTGTNDVSVYIGLAISATTVLFKPELANAEVK